MAEGRSFVCGENKRRRRRCRPRHVFSVGSVCCGRGFKRSRRLPAQPGGRSGSGRDRGGSRGIARCGDAACARTGTASPPALSPGPFPARELRASAVIWCGEARGKAVCLREVGRCRPAALPLRHTCLLLVFASCHRTVVVCGFECRKLCRGGEKKKKRLPALGWMSQRWRQSWSAVSYRGEKKSAFCWRGFVSLGSSAGWGELCQLQRLSVVRLGAGLALGARDRHRRLVVA